MAMTAFILVLLSALFVSTGAVPGAFCVNDPESDDACSDAIEFCGLDSQCHNISCANYFEYGVPNSTKTETLECTSVENETEVNSLVRYRCLADNEIVGASATPDQVCTSGDFTCYDFSSGYDFTAFQEEAAGSNLTCPDETKAPDFTYLYQLIGFGFNVSSMQRLAFTEEFNETLAQHVATAEVVAPTPSPTTRSPTASPSRTSSASKLSACWISGIVTAVMAVMAVSNSL